ncbi:unnamed protein product [Urochloa decumbens]|uniref:Uncharacterized protein n=1 Tax=Urochloa decumbens TaxID=240449 RepID=A0ABC9GY23_9POAL
MPNSECAAPVVDDSHSASAIVAVEAAAGSHLLHVEGYSRTTGVPNGQSIKSRPFKIGGCSWRVWYYPNGGRSNYADYISVFLAIDETVAQPVKAKATFSLLDPAGRPVASHTRTTSMYHYSAGGSGHGFDDFIKREFLEKSVYIKDDGIKIRCDVNISEEIHTEDRAAASPFVVVPPSDMHRHFGDLLATEVGADVTFKVAGETFRAHRNILAARSRVFKAELLGEMRESTATGDCIQIDDMLVEVFKALLHFVYNDSLPEMEVQEEAVMAQHLLEAADMYDMPRLKLICEDKLCNHLEVSSVATSLALAEQHNCQGLKDACMEFLISSDTLDAVMLTDGFEHLTKSCPALVKELISKLAARLYKRRKLRA